MSEVVLLKFRWVESILAPKSMRKTECSNSLSPYSHWNLMMPGSLSTILLNSLSTKFKNIQTLANAYNTLACVAPAVANNDSLSFCNYTRSMDAKLVPKKIKWLLPILLQDGMDRSLCKSKSTDFVNLLILGRGRVSSC